MFEDKNLSTQPLSEMEIFNNWNAIVEGWYCVGRLGDLAEKNLFSVQIGNQELVVFKTSEGKIHCLDGFCSHMGLRLKIGSVEGNELKCKFHHWRFNGEGEVRDSGCNQLTGRRSLNSYPVEVRYDLIWIWAGNEPLYQLPDHPDFPDNKFTFKIGKAYSRPSHPHISLLNALDIQHVNTVHALDLHVSANHFEARDGSFIHYDFTGEFLKNSKTGRRNAFLTGGGYQFSVRYSGSTIGFLKALQGIRLFGKIPFPPIYATFGYRQTGKNKTIIQPVFLTKKRSGLLGILKSWLHLKMTEFIYNRLKNEDGEIYENIRFTPNLTQQDSTITAFIGHVNRLKKSSF